MVRAEWEKMNAVWNMPVEIFCQIFKTIQLRDAVLGPRCGLFPDPLIVPLSHARHGAHLQILAAPLYYLDI